MSWHLEFNSHSGVACLTFAGDATYDEILKSTEALISMLNESGSRKILTDFAKAGTVAVTSIDIAQLPNRYKDLGLTGNFYEGIVAPIGGTMHGAALFYETVCTNRGNMVRVFETRDEALRWLSR